MVDMTNNAEVSLVGIGAACGAVAVYVGTLDAIPLEIKAPIAGIFGAVSAAIGAFWAAKVKAKTPEQSPPTVGGLFSINEVKKT